MWRKTRVFRITPLRAAGCQKVAASPFSFNQSFHGRRKEDRAAGVAAAAVA